MKKEDKEDYRCKDCKFFEDGRCYRTPNSSFATWATSRICDIDIFKKKAKKELLNEKA